MSFSDYINDISFALNRFGVEPLFFLLAAVFLLVWLAAIDVRRQKNAEGKLKEEIARLRAQLEADGEQSSSAETSEPAQKKKPEALSKAESPEAGPASSASVFTGLSKTRGRFFGRLKEILSGHSGFGAEQYEALEELLITSDLGVSTSSRLLERLKESAKDSENITEESLRTELKSFVFDILDDPSRAIEPQRRGKDPLVILVVGVNGVGKTTTIGKLAQHFAPSGTKILLGACDTFRAAAVEQLQAWGERVGVDVWAGDPEAKPSTVAYQAIHKAKDEDYDVLIVDTAGRLHTRVNLMNELENVVQILARELPGAPHETLLVLDATTGQNALQQAREFNQRATLSGLVVTKLDGTPKGGIVVAIKDELSVPIRYIGVGEGASDLKVFKASEFVDAMFAAA